MMTTIEERWDTDGAESIRVLTPCVTCKHRIGATTCRAFPSGIPQIVLIGDNQHRTPIQGDQGIQYEPKL